MSNPLSRDNQGTSVPLSRRTRKPCPVGKSSVYRCRQSKFNCSKFSNLFHATFEDVPMLMKMKISFERLLKGSQ